MEPSPVKKKVNLGEYFYRQSEALQFFGITDFEPKDGAINEIKHLIIEDILEFESVKALLTMEWDLPEFMKSQYPDAEDANLGSVITLTGTVLHAQATTCLEYVKQTWPSQGCEVVMAFQSAIDSCQRKAQGF